MKIGFFDSGLGGLTILKAVRNMLPEYDYVFFGDTLHVPFGDKTEEEIYEFTKEGVTRLFEEGALLVVVACNTASAETLRRLQDTFLREEHPDKKILGVIIPTIETLDEFHAAKPLLVGTKRTVDSKKFEKELQKINSQVQLITRSAPEVAPLIEEQRTEEALSQMTKVIDPLVGEADAVVLACTHYTVLKDELRKHYDMPIISQDEIIPEKLQIYLKNHPEIESKLSKNGTAQIILSKDTAHYEEIKKTFL